LKFNILSGIIVTFFPESSLLLLAKWKARAHPRERHSKNWLAAGHPLASAVHGRGYPEARNARLQLLCSMESLWVLESKKRRMRLASGQIRMAP